MVIQRYKKKSPVVERKRFNACWKYCSRILGYSAYPSSLVDGNSQWYLFIGSCRSGGLRSIVLTAMVAKLVMVSLEVCYAMLPAFWQPVAHKYQREQR